MRRWVAITAAVTLVSGCWGSAPDGMALSFGTYSTTPVMLIEMTVNGQPANMPLPSVQQGNADVAPLRRSSGTLLGSWPGASDTAQINATWVELLTDRAYRAEVTVDTAALPRTATNIAEVKPIFGPHGLMILAGEPSGADPEHVDLAKICGTRSPDRDENFTARPLAHARLTEALQVEYPPVPATTHCPDPAQ